MRSLDTQDQGPLILSVRARIFAVYVPPLTCFGGVMLVMSDGECCPTHRDGALEASSWTAAGRCHLAHSASKAAMFTLILCLAVYAYLLTKVHAIPQHLNGVQNRVSIDDCEYKHHSSPQYAHTYAQVLWQSTT